MIADHKTSVSLEDEFWQSVKQIALVRGMRVADLVEEIDKGREQANLSSAIRLYVLGYYRALGAWPVPRSLSNTALETAQSVD